MNDIGHGHELTFSCHNRHRFLAADRTCEWLAEAINGARTAFDFAVWAYVFMPDHVHLIVGPRRWPYDISAILKALKEAVGRRAVKYLQEAAPDWLDRIKVLRGRRVEHRFWEAGGGYDRNITEGATLARMVSYIHENPVRAGLTTAAEKY